MQANFWVLSSERTQETADRREKALVACPEFGVCHGPVPTQWKLRGPVEGCYRGPLIPPDAPTPDVPFNRHLQ